MKILLSLIWASYAFAAATEPNARVVPFGNDVSATSYVLTPGKCSAGFMALACGVTDHISVGTVPWILTSYNSLNLAVRNRLESSDPEVLHSVQLAYFKSYTNAVRYEYQMEVWWLYYVRSNILTENATVHWNLQAMNFVDDKFPFSIRRPWADRQPWQLNLSALTEVHVYKNYYINAETGLLGATQKWPELMIGVNFEYRTQSWLFHFGFLQTGTSYGYSSLNGREDYQSALLNTNKGFSGKTDDELSLYDYSIHPEIGIQYYF